MTINQTIFPIRLEQSFMIAPRVKHFVFKCQHDSVFDFVAGQFITIHFEHQGKPLKRSYSIANSPCRDNRIEIAASFIEGGPGTELLFHLKPNDVLSMTGPFGRLTLKEPPPKRYVLLATSTGVTPYRAMLSELEQFLEKSSHHEVVILQGVPKREDILYRDEFLDFAKKHKNASFRPYLSREALIEPQEYKGRVHHAFPDLNLNPEQDLVYLCGNPNMIDHAFEELKQRGFSVQHIIREKYISR